jgi:hypothetical protein
VSTYHALSHVCEGCMCYTINNVFEKKFYDIQVYTLFDEDGPTIVDEGNGSH